MVEDGGGNLLKFLQERFPLRHESKAVAQLLLIAAAGGGRGDEHGDVGCTRGDSTVSIGALDRTDGQD